MKIKNAKSLPVIYYGLHFAPGVAEYEGGRIFINEQTAKKMDRSFQGKPVYVEHVDEVNLENIQNEADGWVVRSFWNKSDGQHWVEFLVVSDEAKQAIQNGWKLSNAYVPKQMSGGGLWHGVEFSKEITDGEYEHLAIVKNPRYAESVIFSPEEFKQYNEQKEKELTLKFHNSKKEKPQMLKLFKKEKVENALDLENTMVELPLSKKEMPLSQVVNELDKVLNMHGYANGDHMVKVGEEEMSVNDLVKKHMSACNEMMEMKKKNEEVKEPVGGKDLGEEKEGKLYQNEAKEEEKKEDHFAKVANAHETQTQEAPRVLLTADKVARGKKLFGSN